MRSASCEHTSNAWPRWAADTAQTNAGSPTSSIPTRWAAQMRTGLSAFRHAPRPIPLRLRRPGRRLWPNPTSVTPVSPARSAARLEGALTADTTGMPAMAAFSTSSKDVRPDTWRTVPLRGNRFWRSAHPTTLSTALWCPTSSRRQSNSGLAPATLNRPAAWTPPVLSKTAWASPSRSGSSPQRRVHLP